MSYHLNVKLHCTPAAWNANMMVREFQKNSAKKHEILQGLCGFKLIEGEEYTVRKGVPEGFWKMKKARSALIFYRSEKHCERYQEIVKRK